VTEVPQIAKALDGVDRREASEHAREDPGRDGAVEHRRLRPNETAAPVAHEENDASGEREVGEWLRERRGNDQDDQSVLEARPLTPAETLED